ncbi:MAG: nucleoside phosphorylase [Prevotellaceae bacterium]|jgi:uridine phosphorylase|nr:nucleoside phosphorylase [Prevotellaceae bacterium]
MRTILPSELPINADGSAFHLHLKPEQLADTVILVGDPERVTLISGYFDTIECEVRSREFHTVTGLCNGRRISCVSHGIGTDNIDIVVTELDALANIDFATRTVKDVHTPLTLVRIGTSGGLQPFCPIGSFVVAQYSMGFDGLLNYYHTPDGLLEMDIENAFKQHTNWSPRLAAPYVVQANAELVEKIGFDMIKGITISAPGFYGPQGRFVRIPLAFPELNEKIKSFDFDGHKITNFEMESSALAGLAKLLGHRAMTVCAIIAGRSAHTMNTSYKDSITTLIETALERI